MAAVAGLLRKKKMHHADQRPPLGSTVTDDNGQGSVLFSCAKSRGRSPLLWRLGDLLQPTAGLLQLRQRVGWRERRHGRVLDERVPWVMATRVDATADAAAAPGVIPVGQRLGIQSAGLP